MQRSLFTNLRTCTVCARTTGITDRRVPDRPKSRDGFDQFLRGNTNMHAYLDRMVALNFAGSSFSVSIEGLYTDMGVGRGYWMSPCDSKDNLWIQSVCFPMDTDGCARKIKVLKRNACGYRRFDRFRDPTPHIRSHRTVAEPPPKAQKSHGQVPSLRFAPG